MVKMNGKQIKLATVVDQSQCPALFSGDYNDDGYPIMEPLFTGHRVLIEDAFGNAWLHFKEYENKTKANRLLCKIMGKDVNLCQAWWSKI